MSAQAILDSLDPVFAERCVQMFAQLKSQGLIYEPYFGVRTPAEQAKLWRQGRSSDEIAQKITLLRAQHADYIADQIEAAGPQPGSVVTNSVPGASWHNWKLALDSYLVGPDGKPDWTAAKYKPLADAARSLGMTAGWYWTTPDSDHVQHYPEGNPLDHFGGSWSDLSYKLKQAFNG